MTTKHEVLQVHLQEWLACRGNKEERGRLITQLASLLKIHPKSVGRSMRRVQMKSSTARERRGRSVYYGADVDAALFKIWDTMDHPCAENMHPAIREYITYFTAERDWPFDDVTTGKICAVSVGTLKRKIKRLRKKHDLPRGRSATVSSPLKGMIPIRKSHTWQHLPPGYVQTDTVVHCGDLLTGDVVYSLGCVDFATYWSEYTAQWNKGKEATCESLELVRTRFPFPIQELHPDSGDEFINYHVHAWSKKRGIEMTRSEPYKKNDNMCIEERNNSLARKHLGYARLDAIEFVPLAQEIPRVACLLHNHFRPVRRMISKVRIGAKWKRTFEKKAQTPYQRMLEHAAVSEENKDALRIVHETLNPLELKRQLDILKTQLGRKVVERLVAKKKASQ